MRRKATKRVSTRRAARKASKRRPRAQFRQTDHVSPEVEVKPLRSFVIDFRFFSHVTIEAESLDDAFKRAKEITVIDAWQRARKYRTEIVSVFTPDHAHAKTRSSGIGRTEIP